MEKLLQEIASKNALVNVIIQVQSYGRVFIYDQLGKVVPQDDAICVYPKENTIEERIVEGLKVFKSKM